MKKRKYLSEFGLGVYTSYKTIIPVEHLELVNDGKEYHIYSIMASPKLKFNKNTINLNNDGISVCIEKQVEDGFESIQINKLVLDRNLDHSKLQIECKFPYNSMEIEVNDDNWMKTYGRNLKSHKIILDAQSALNFSETKSVWELEILYIGQAFGKNGERLATDRLKSHSTLQRILADYHSLHPDKRLYIFLYEYTPQLQISFDGLSSIYSTSREEDERHFNEVLSNPLKYNQVINITEAAMINYFKPSYNVNFVENFPNEGHKGYSQYYDLDYNNLVVEIDLDFDGSSLVELWTENNKINNSFNYIKYDLFNDPARKNMYDIFKSAVKRDDN